MQKEVKWIYLSIFYGSEEREKLIKELLFPFLILEKKARNNIDWIFFFNLIQGQNIRLAIRGEEEKLTVVLTEIHRLANNFFITSKVEQEQNNYCGSEFFMNFRINSIHYNLFKVNFDSFDLNLCFLVSRAILQVFSSEPYNDKNIFSFLLYCYMAMAVVWHNVGFELSRSMHEEIDKTVLLGYPTLEELFNKNIELFQSVFLDILNDRVDGESSFDLLGFKEGFSELIIIKRASNSIVLPNHVLHLLNANPNLLRVIEYIIERCFEMIN